MKRPLVVGVMGLPLIFGCGGISSKTPKISSISPSSITVYGTHSVVITGTDFTPEKARVSVDGKNCAVTAGTTTSITCTAPSHVAGSANWTVTNSDGSPSASYSNFTYVPPAAVIGQTSGTTNLATAGSYGLNIPYGVYLDGNRLLVADCGNNRVLIWNSVPTSSTQAADLVLGQTNFTSTTANQGVGIGASTMSCPNLVSVYQNKLIVSDYSNNRILIWTSFPTANGQAADVVIGQPGFTTGTPNIGTRGANTLHTIRGLVVDSSGGLYIADNGNNRILYYPTIPSTSGASASAVLGQTDFTSGGTGTSATTFMFGPQRLSISGSYLAAHDSGNNRVLFYRLPISTNGQAAIRVLGQSGFGASSTLGCTSQGIKGWGGVYLKENALYVADADQARVLYWPDITNLTDGQAASQVFGQSNMTTCTTNTGNVTQTNLGTFVSEAFSDPVGYLWVVDSTNHRITINQWP